jgi:hypothetical protein
MIEAKRFPPVPERFRQRFIEDGWRGIERYYGARTEVMLQWIAECGGLIVLKAERRAYRQQRAEAARLPVAKFVRLEAESNIRSDLGLPAVRSRDVRSAAGRVR